MVRETDAVRPPIALSAAREIVVLPAPEGAESMNIIPRREGETHPILVIYSGGRRFCKSSGAGPYSTFCTCSRIFSSLPFTSTVSRESSAFWDFAPIVFTSRLTS